MLEIIIILLQILTINANDTVQWINDGGWHDVNFDINSQTGTTFGNPEAFQSAATGSGVIYTHVFTILEHTIMIAL